MTREEAISLGLHEVLQCRDCGAAVGEEHEASCDTAVCPKCHGQRLDCCDKVYPTVHSGFWPGEKVGAALGWWTRWGPPWISCTKEESIAGHPYDTGYPLVDLNRVAVLRLTGRDQSFTEKTIEELCQEFEISDIYED